MIVIHSHLINFSKFDYDQLINIEVIYETNQKEIGNNYVGSVYIHTYTCIHIV